MSKHNHYFKDVSHLKSIDVYRIIDLYNVTNPCIQHALKKVLVAGGRGAGKDVSKDIQEAIDSLERWKEMQTECSHMSISPINMVIGEPPTPTKPFKAIPPFDEKSFELKGCEEYVYGGRDVKITHIATGLSAHCDAHVALWRNREQAKSWLRSDVIAHYLAEEAMREDRNGN